MYEFTVKAGEGLLFPPGWLHETYNIAPGCTAALTTQFDYPRPMGYFREFYNRIHRVGDLGTCWNSIRNVASASFNLPLAQKDVDGDGKVTGDEIITPANYDRFNFIDESIESRTVEIETVKQLAKKWKATERAIQSEPEVRAHHLGFDMSLGLDGLEPAKNQPRHNHAQGELEEDGADDGDDEL